MVNRPVLPQELNDHSGGRGVQKEAQRGRPAPRWFLGLGGGFGWTTDSVLDYLHGTGWSYELRALYVLYKRVDLRGLIGFHLFRHAYALNKNALSDRFDVSPKDIQLQPGQTDLTGLLFSIGGAGGLNKPPNVNHFLTVTMDLGVYHHRRQDAVVTGRDQSTPVPGMSETRFAVGLNVGYLTDLGPSLLFYLDGRFHMLVRALHYGENAEGVIHFGLVAGFLVGL